MIRRLAAGFCLVWGLVSGVWASAPDDARLVSAPAIARDHIAFLYAGDVWIAGRDGSNARRLTSHPGDEINPAISPDGKLVAFTAHYDGNADVYVVPVEGGEPRRLTWHPGVDLVSGFTPDGQVLFTSPRSVYTGRYRHLFKVSPAGGVPEPIPVPSADDAAISPDGRYLAYTPLGERFRQWKNYRGGTMSRIWVLKLDDLSHMEIPKPAGGCNDTRPMWLGNEVYFLSDRDGEFNLYSYSPSTRRVARRTNHDVFPIASASAGADRVIYEQAGWLHVYDPTRRTSERLRIAAAADFAETRPRRVSGPKYVRAASISPTGKRVALEFRGEIVTVPASKGDPHNLTRSTGAHDRDPAWSPDGKSIAYFSDSGGEYKLVVTPQNGRGEAQSFPIDRAGFYERPIWSPDSKNIAFIDNSRTIYVIDLATGTLTRVAADAIYGPLKTLAHRWSPDSRWLAYVVTNKVAFQSLWLFDRSTGKSHPLTDGLVEAGTPVFDASGKYLYFTASTDAGPVKNWFDQQFSDIRATSSIYLVTLGKDTPNPLLKENEEEATEDDKSPSTGSKSVSAKGERDQSKTGAPADSRATTSPAKKPAPKVEIDFEGIEDRIVALPVEAGWIDQLTAGPEGQILYLRKDSRHGLGESAGNTTLLKRYDLKKREEETLAEGIDEVSLSADHKKILYAAGSPGGETSLLAAEKPRLLGVVDLGKFKVGEGALKLDQVEVEVDPRAEWPQILREAWRINRDYFYAANMHGANWDAVLKKYEEFLPDLTTRADLSRVITMMLSELAVGHSYQFGGERLYEPKPIPVGLLGADYEVAEGRFRFKTIYGGAFWDPALRAPLRTPGVSVKPGEFLLAVEGREVKAESEVYRAFEGLAGRRIEIKVGPHADGSDSRTLVVEPITDELALRNRAWVEHNLHLVHERTGGRVAYVYVPNTAGSGYSYFKRYFFPQGDKDAIIIDERFNGGGQVADYYIEMLRRPLVSYWATRYGEVLREPNAMIQGPKVMLIDETAGSGGDLLPWMFRKFRMGTLVGKRTWGGLVGILGFPQLMDGGVVTAPNIAIFTEDGWVVENQGVSPDVEVEQDPAAVAAGKDPQLERAIAIVLDELTRNPPPKRPSRPPLPIRVRPESGVAGQPGDPAPPVARSAR